MSLTLNGGPVAGHYMCQRAPLWLRGVVAANGKRDVLDLPEDGAAADEAIYVYRRIGTAGHVHINTGLRRGTGFYALAKYDYVETVDGAALRGTDEWREWCANQEPEVGR